MTAQSLVATRRPAAVSSATSFDDTSGMYDAPRLIVATFRASRSIPVTVNPLRANSTANGNPTYPRPTTPTRASRDFRRSSRQVASSDIDRPPRKAELPDASEFDEPPTRLQRSVGRFE